jgi:hypothetical protein
LLDNTSSINFRMLGEKVFGLVQIGFNRE